MPAACVHRDKFAVLATESSWTIQDSESVARSNVDWVEELAAGLRSHVSASAYQNFIDRSQPDWEAAYYGENLQRLREVKRRYDPDDLLNFEQSIRPA